MSEPRYFGVIPAAGAGSRMGGETPKQYLDLDGVTVLQRSLEALLALPQLDSVVVALSADDTRWAALPAASDPRVFTTPGGAERSDSVLAGLDALADRAGAEDWVLVHDAARPCLVASDLDRLVVELAADPVGGLLATPVAETVKRSDVEGRVLETVPRESLWLAQTPQMFRFGLLRDALTQAAREGRVITDEASAIEQAGQRPKLVAGSVGNLKITRPGDLAQARKNLNSMGDAQECE